MNTPSGTRLVEAHYVPKCMKVTKNNDGSYRIDIRAPTILTIALIVVLLIIGVYVVPSSFIAGGFSGGFRFSLFGALIGALVPLAILISIGYFLIRMFRPPIIISAEGVQVGKRFFAMGDVDGFRNYADDWWVFGFARKLDFEAIGVHYGIYSIHTPYLLSNGEADKGAIYLTKLLKSVAPDPGQERDHKIQQAEEF